MRSAAVFVLLMLCSCPLVGQNRKASDSSRARMTPLDGPFDTSECTKLYTMADGLASGAATHPGNRQRAIDSLKHFIEHCYNHPLAPSIFSEITNIVGMDTTGNADSGARWIAYRDWAFKVLYLRWPFQTLTDSQYYCHDAESSVSYFRHVQGGDYAAEIAIARYLLNSGKCPWDSANSYVFLKGAMRNWHLYWQDTVKDSMATPFDTTIPTLEQIGFQILLGPQFGSVDPRTMPKSILGEITANPNPFTHQAHLQYIVNLSTSLTIDVFDALGAKVQNPLPSVYTHDGMYDLDVGSGLPSGSYYVRFSVPADNEVRTVKIVKN
jgi:hypothetical protein